MQVSFYVTQNHQKTKWAYEEKAQIDAYDSLSNLGDLPTVMTAITFDIPGGKGFYDEMLSVVWPEDHKVDKYEYFTSRKIFAPVFLRRDSIFIFDHVMNKMVVFNYNKVNGDIHLHSVLKDSITYNRKKGWLNLIIQDSYTGDFFTAYRNDRYILSNIKILGKEKACEIIFPKKHNYVDKVKVYKHQVYYLWKDPGNENSFRTLYKLMVE